MTKKVKGNDKPKKHISYTEIYKNMTYNRT